ncbi:C40 family peptidase [Corynebacterium caspium]|uniref:C40 family peptidase n=1 Tax=Corynebacterium caspium TaxID=234828 RepID=UPI0003674C7C|nr:C40 family peptidase [Corynebacterium caspium]WKD59757.1 putative endopeptidase precursor [Corynebacterium caspium DSM 44850]
MLDISQILNRISTLIPALPIPPGLFPAPPDLTALAPLAKELQTNPTALINAANILVKHQHEVRELLDFGHRLITNSHYQLLGLAQKTAAQATPLLITAFSPDPLGANMARAKLFCLAISSLREAQEKLEQLGIALAKPAARLTEIGENTLKSAIQPGGESPGLASAISVGAGGGSGGGSAVDGCGAGAGDAGAADGIAGAAGPGGETGMNKPGSTAVAAARSAMGVPYIWGGTGSNGFDCSGLTQWAWRQAGVELPRTAENQAVGQAVTAVDLQEGDLVVWDGHVAMYAGNGEIIEAGDPVQVNPLRTSNMGMAFKGFYRPVG